MRFDMLHIESLRYYGPIRVTLIWADMSCLGPLGPVVKLKVAQDHVREEQRRDRHELLGTSVLLQLGDHVLHLVAELGLVLLL